MSCGNQLPTEVNTTYADPILCILDRKTKLLGFLSALHVAHHSACPLWILDGLYI